jgi:predicted alpha/beta-fold hydrolase
MKFSQLKHLGKLFQPERYFKITANVQDDFYFKPSTLLSHPFLQSVYCITEPRISVNYEREKLFFDDGGHISLDWSQKVKNDGSPPILFIMHGLTGGS